MQRLLPSTAANGLQPCVSLARPEHSPANGRHPVGCALLLDRRRRDVDDFSVRKIRLFHPSQQSRLGGQVVHVAHVGVAVGGVEFFIAGAGDGRRLGSGLVRIRQSAQHGHLHQLRRHLGVVLIRRAGRQSGGLSGLAGIPGDRSPAKGQDCGFAPSNRLFESILEQQLAAGIQALTLDNKSVRAFVGIVADNRHGGRSCTNGLGIEADRQVT